MVVACVVIRDLARAVTRVEVTRPPRIMSGWVIEGRSFLRLAGSEGRLCEARWRREGSDVGLRR